MFLKTNNKDDEDSTALETFLLYNLKWKTESGGRNQSGQNNPKQNKIATDNIKTDKYC